MPIVQHRRRQRGEEEQPSPLADPRLLPLGPPPRLSYRSFSVGKGEVLTVECFSFFIAMLPSINEKHKLGRGGRGTHVDPVYRARELQEIARINQQREMVGWSPPRESDRYGILYEFSFPTELLRDLHNPIKPTCDLFGKGRYETLGSGKLKRQIFVFHAQIIQNDNRVLAEYQHKEVHPGEEIQWATIHLFRTQAGPYAKNVLRYSVAELALSLSSFPFAG